MVLTSGDNYYCVNNENGKVVITRADRINYAIYGGFDNNALFAMGLKDDIDKARKNLLSTIDSLSKYTHINEDTFDVSDSDTERSVNHVVDSFNEFVKCMAIIRRQVISCLEAEINQEILMATLYNTYDAIDCMSTHSGYITNIYIPYQACVSAEIKSSLKKFRLNDDIQFEFDTDTFYE